MPILVKVSELKDSHTGKIRARSIAFAVAAEPVAAEAVSAGCAIALIGAELVELRERNT